MKLALGFLGITLAAASGLMVTALSGDGEESTARPSLVSSRGVEQVAEASEATGRKVQAVLKDYQVTYAVQQPVEPPRNLSGGTSVQPPPVGGLISPARVPVNLGFDFIGPDSSWTDGNTFYTSHEDTGSLGWYAISAQPWSTPISVSADHLFVVWGVPQTSQPIIAGFVVNIWSTYQEFWNNPFAGDVHSQWHIQSDSGSLVVPYGANPGGLNYLIGFNLPSVQLQPGNDYYFSIHGLDDFMNPYTGGVSESSSLTQTGFQIGDFGGGQYGVDLNAIGGTSFNGVAAYRLDVH